MDQSGLQVTMREAIPQGTNPHLIGPDVEKPWD